jgi:excisionase family DNA binding protein
MTTNVDALLQLLSEQISERVADQIVAQLAERDNGNESPWLSIDAAAAHLDWPKQRLYKLTAQGAIPHYKHDGRLLFRRDELDQWLRMHAQPAR